MEGLKELAASTFEKVQKFQVPGADFQYPVIEIGAFPEGHFDFNEWLVEQDDLDSFMRKRPIDEKRNAADASLKLVCIQRNLDAHANGILGISKEAFARVLDSMCAHPCILYMIARDYDGYHEFNGEESPVTTYVGAPTYALVWVFDRKKMTTRGLCLQRRPGAWSDLRDVLSLYKSYIFTPNLLSFTSSLYLLQHFDAQTNEDELRQIREIESPAGFHIYDNSNHMGSKRVDIDQLTHLSQVTGKVQSSIANKLRHLKMLKDILDLIQLEYQTKVADVVAPEFLNRYHRSMEALNEAIPAIERHMGAYEEFLICLKDRAKRLSSVLFALLTREDAESNSDLVASSTDLVTVSKKDSSSTKAIATITMAFLPATFFAAVFAVPSLQWDHQVVIQRNFWVYWSLALPATAGVFSVWFGITRWGRGSDASTRKRGTGRRRVPKALEESLN